MMSYVVSINAKNKKLRIPKSAWYIEKTKISIPLIISFSVLDLGK